MSQEVEIEWTGSGATSGVYDDFCTCCECEYLLGATIFDTPGFWVTLAGAGLDPTSFVVILDVVAADWLPESLEITGGWVNLDDASIGTETLLFDSYPVFDGVVHQRFMSAPFTVPLTPPGVEADVRADPAYTLCLDPWNPAITGLVTGMGGIGA